MMIDPLSEIAIRHGTDKYGFHDYTPNYHKLFSDRRNMPLRILEIGVGGYGYPDRGGQSLATWRDYFATSEITGIDIQPKRLSLGSRVTIMQGSQVDPEFLNEVVQKRGPFDIIIDDGSHQNEHVVASFKMLWPELAPGGIYVAEDVQTAFFPRYGGSLTLDGPNSVGFFRDIFTTLGERTSDLTRSVVAIERFHNIIAVHKADHSAGQSEFQKSSAFNFRGPLSIENIAASDADAGTIGAALARLPRDGLVIISGRLAKHQIDMLGQIFVEVDHREISVNYPETKFGPHAREIYGLERYSDGVILIKADNDYPSNFGFDASQAQADRAIRNMAEVLETSDSIDGMASLAGLLAATQGMDAASPWLDRLSSLGARTRAYFKLALARAQQSGNQNELVQIARKAVAVFPEDVDFTVALANELLILGQTEQAEETILRSLELNPESPKLHLLMMRTARALKRIEAAIDHANSAVLHSKDRQRAQAQIALANLLREEKRSEEAVDILLDAIKTSDKGIPRAWRSLSGAYAEIGNTREARAAIAEALSLAPDSKEFRQWAHRLDALNGES
jgi:tetratricopeptide (TPR) repeat protein